MDQSTTASPNADQITYWNARAGNTWASMQKRLDTQIGPIGLKALDALAPREGERVIDIGCGCGTTSFEIARRVGASGHVSAVDISQPMLDIARRDAERDRVHNVEFLEADAQTHAFEPATYDALYSRFGVMFFSDPVAAFRNLLAALKSESGRLAFACWRPLKENPWMAFPVKAAMQHLPPQETTDPLAPGPYAFADAERVKRILAEAGFVKIAAAPHDQKVAMGQLDDAVEQCTRVGPLSRLLLEYPDAVTPVMETLRNTLAEYTSEGVVRMDSAAWIVTARRA
ncbi:MAG: class I SAM-dependent methyltransferase [Beijerinckiaceae bacterium]